MTWVSFSPPLAAELVHRDGSDLPIEQAACALHAYGRWNGEPFALLTMRTGEFEELKDITRLRILDVRVTTQLAEAVAEIAKDRAA